MIKTVLVLLYLYKGQVTFEKSYHRDLDACIASGQARAQALIVDPRFEGGLYADCVQEFTQEAQK